MSRQWTGIAFVAIVAAVLAARYFLGPDPHHDAQAAREIATRGLAEAVAVRHAGKRAMILSNPFTQRPGIEKRIVQMEEAGLRGLRSTLEGRVAIGAVVHPELRPEARENPRAVHIDPETTTPLSYLVATDAFDRAVQGHPDCEVVISLIGLPVELEKCDAWKREGSPVFALLLPDLRMVGGADAVVAAVKAGKLTAIVLRRPDGVADGVPPGKDFKAEFERRFVLVTRENAEEVARKWPGLLQGP